jgi:hypothetical protein
MNYVYQLIETNPQLAYPGLLPDQVPDQNKLNIKYENLLNQSKELCKKYTGPHSVLQIFLEKIINCIG